MRIALGCDHGGLPLKQALTNELEKLGHTVIDCGAKSLDPADDYPDFTRVVGGTIQRGEAERGVVVCGSGVGASIAASKMVGIRASVCHDTYSARQGVEHDNMNVLCLGARVVGDELARELVRAFATAQFSGEERHVRRLNKVLDIEKNRR